MNRSRSTRNAAKEDQEKEEEEDPIKSVERVLSLSDDDFAKWVDRVVSAGLKIRK